MAKHTIGVAEIVEHVSKIFEPFTIKGVDSHENKQGVVVQYNKVDAGVIVFLFVVKGAGDLDQTVQLTMDVINQSREQMQEMIDDVFEMIEGYRAARASSLAPTIITPDTLRPANISDIKPISQVRH